LVAGELTHIRGKAVCGGSGGVWRDAGKLTAKRREIGTARPRQQTGKENAMKAMGWPPHFETSGEPLFDANAPPFEISAEPIDMFENLKPLVGSEDQSDGFSPKTESN
jgi:hypothetical protein